MPSSVYGSQDYSNISAINTLLQTPPNTSQSYQLCYQALTQDRVIRPLRIRRKMAITDETKPSANTLAAIIAQANESTRLETPSRLPLSPIRNAYGPSVPISTLLNSYQFPAHKRNNSSSDATRGVLPPSLPKLLPSPVLNSSFATPAEEQVRPTLVRHRSHTLDSMNSTTASHHSEIRDGTHSFHSGTHKANRKRVHIQTTVTRTHTIRLLPSPSPTPVVPLHPASIPVVGLEHHQQAHDMTSPTLAAISLTRALRLADQTRSRYDEYTNLRLAPLRDQTPLKKRRLSADQEMDEKEREIKFRSRGKAKAGVLMKRRGVFLAPLDL